jgi:hypothetical protein
MIHGKFVVQSKRLPRTPSDLVPTRNLWAGTGVSNRRFCACMQYDTVAGVHSRHGKCVVQSKRLPRGTPVKWEVYEPVNGMSRWAVYFVCGTKPFT